MYNLIEFLRKYHYIILFLILEGISFTLLFRFNHYQGNVWFSAANSAAAQIDRWYADALSYLELRTINRQLTDENIRLQLEADQLRQALITATHDSTYTEQAVHRNLAGYQLVPATVVSNSRNRSNNYIVIDKGETDGIRAEMGVVGGGGVVGIVYLTGPHYSLVLPVTNKKSSISCRVRGQRYFGYLEWEGESLGHAHLDDIPRYANIKKGECIETSGYSSVFPPGIFVGRISGISNSEDGQTYRLNINLGTDFANLRDVNVTATPYKAEIDTLRSRAARTDAAYED